MYDLFFFLEMLPFHAKNPRSDRIIIIRGQKFLRKEGELYESCKINDQKELEKFCIGIGDIDRHNNRYENYGRNGWRYFL